MNKTWVIAEQLKDASFRIVKLVDAETEPTEEFRKGVIEICELYRNSKMPNNTVCLFKLTDEEASCMLFEAPPEYLHTVFEELKTAGRTTCNDTVSIQRSAWCYSKGIDVLEYSLQNGGGGKNNRMNIVSNPDFQTFRDEKCELD